LGELSDGIAIADRLHALADDLSRHLQTHADHEIDAGAHAAAFDAHGQSPGVVEDAEELAEDIIETATDTADELIEAIQDTGTEALATVADAAETAAEVPSEVVGSSEPEGEEEAPEEPQSAGERPRSNRSHILHAKVF
jgi:hypothetical protein